MERNTILDGNIRIGRLNSGIIIDNKVINGKIHITSMNMALENNLVVNMETVTDYAYRYDYSQEDNNSYNIYDVNNSSQGDFQVEKSIDDGNRINVSYSKDELENFKKEINY